MIPWAGGMRWAYSEKGWIGFFASLPNQRILLRHELTFRRVAPEDAARQVLAFTQLRGITLAYIASQPELWPAHDTGESVSETFAKAGVPMRKGDKDRVNRWSRIRSWLAQRAWPDGTFGPSLLIHPDCKYFLRTFPTLVQHETKPDDIQETPDEYPAAGLSYYAMSRPAPWLPQPKPQPGPGTWGYELRHLRQTPRRYVGSNLVRSR